MAPEKVMGGADESYTNLELKFVQPAQVST